MKDLYFNELGNFGGLGEGTKEDVLRTMAKNLEAKGLVKESFSDAVIAREQVQATGLPTMGVSVAMQHTEPEHVTNKALNVAVPKEQVEFGVMGGKLDPAGGGEWKRFHTFSGGAATR